MYLHTMISFHQRITKIIQNTPKIGAKLLQVFMIVLTLLSGATNLTSFFDYVIIILILYIASVFLGYSFTNI